MKFCKVCDNMMYIRTDASGGVYTCKMCASTEALRNEDGSPIMVTDMRTVDDELKYRRYTTPYLVHDATLPHVSNIACPNQACSKAADAPHDVILVKYDPDKLRFMYTCAHCRYHWLNDRGRTSRR